MPLNLPNLLTWLRILFIPLMVGVFYLPDGWVTPYEANLLAAAFFGVAALTDWLDGYLARKLGQTSAFGAFLDPVADKLMVAAALIVLMHLGRVAPLVALIIIGREITISALREWMAQGGQIGQRGGVIRRQAENHGTDDRHRAAAVFQPGCRPAHRQHRDTADLGRRAAHPGVDGVLPCDGCARAAKIFVKIVDRKKRNPHNAQPSTRE